MVGNTVLGGGVPCVLGGEVRAAEVSGRLHQRGGGVDGRECGRKTRSRGPDYHSSPPQVSLVGRTLLICLYVWMCAEIVVGY